MIGGERRAIGLGYGLAVVPLVGLIALTYVAITHGTTAMSPVWDWLPGVGGKDGVGVRFRFDGLGLMFGFLITGIGALVLAYGGHYMAHDPSPTRFLFTLTGFLLAMLGLVLADDLVAVFVFWELTSVTSYLLIGHTRTEQAKRGALQALLVTGVGGLFLLAGIVLLWSVTGTTSLTALAGMGDVVRGSALYLPVLVLMGVGCLAKSAQFPLHFWLPDSMSAPTPASAFLHSATMVKAGVYLLFRLEPVLGGTLAWSMMLVPCGAATVVVGAWQGLRQTDLKALLAYSTLSQLGALVMLLGIGGEKAMAAVVVGILGHAAYKSALFLGVGIVDHAAGTREIVKLGGLRRALPITATVMAVAAVSMAGLPPTFGFVAKELALGAGMGTGGWLVVGVTAMFGVMMVAQAGQLWFATFWGERRGEDGGGHLHDPSVVMWMAVAIPAVAGLVLPWVGGVVEGGLSAAAGGGKVSVFPFHGLTGELAVSAGAIGLGALVFLWRRRVIAGQNAVDPGHVLSAVYDGVLRLADWVAWVATRVQSGDLRTYLVVMTVATAALVSVAARFHVETPTGELSAPKTPIEAALGLLRGFTLVLVLVSSLASVLLKKDFHAILGLGASGIAMALMFALEPAPDVALVMVVADILTIAVLLLALARVPTELREVAAARERRSHRKYLNLAVAAVVALGTASMAYMMLDERPRASLVTPYYEKSAKELTGAADIVGAIVLDFRGFDTLIEITVFSLAGIGVYGLLRYASRYAGDVPPPGLVALLPGLPRGARGISPAPASTLVRGLGQVLLPVCIMISVVHMMFGHNQPGDGFTAGVTTALGVSVYFVTQGYKQARARLRWIRPLPLIACGLLLVISVEALSGWMSGRGTFFAPFDFGVALGIAPYLPYGFSLSSSFFFEVSIFLTVLGSSSALIDSLGTPLEADEVERFSLSESSPMMIDTDEAASPEDVVEPGGKAVQA